MFPRILYSTLIVIAVHLIMPAAHAQQYEQGSGIGGCQAGSGVCNGWQWQGQSRQESPQPQQPPAPPMKWADRWGTIVIGGESGKPAIFGVSSNMPSKSTAETLAINKCKTLGGGGTCKIFITYHNQCITLAEGNPIGTQAVNGPDLNEIKVRALKLCNAQYKNCDIVYSECSMPVRIQ